MASGGIRRTITSSAWRPESPTDCPADVRLSPQDPVRSVGVRYHPVASGVNIDGYPADVSGGRVVSGVVRCRPVASGGSYRISVLMNPS